MKYWVLFRVTVALLALATTAPLPVRAQVIAGRVTDDRTAQPAVDYPVRLVHLVDTGLVVLGETTTDGTGAFSVVAPSAGDYVLTFGKTAPRLQRVAVAVVPGATPPFKDYVLPIQRTSDTRPYVDEDMDSDLHLAPRAAGPAYPPAQRAAKRNGSLFAMFVIDSTGHAEKHSVRLFAGTHIDFAAETEHWLETALFRAPRVGGVPVREQVCLPLVFASDDQRVGSQQATSPQVPRIGLSNFARSLCTRALDKQGTMTIVVMP
jgi:hypothetical protein